MNDRPACVDRLYDDTEAFRVFACETPSETNDLARYIRALEVPVEPDDPVRGWRLLATLPNGLTPAQSAALAYIDALKRRLRAAEAEHEEDCGIGLSDKCERRVP